MEGQGVAPDQHEINISFIETSDEVEEVR